MKSFHRADVDEPAALPGQPVVHVTQFDGPRPTTISCPVDISGNWSPKKEMEMEDSTRVAIADGGAMEEYILLPNGRRSTGVVIADDADGYAQTEGGVLVPQEEPLPGGSADCDG